MIEDRLRDAIEAHRAPDVGKPGWDLIEQRAADARHHAARQRAARRVVMVAASVAAIGVATTAVLRDGDSRVRVVANDPAPTTTAAPATTTSAAAPEPAPAPDPATVDGIYPDRTAYERDGADRYRDPRVAAAAFATDYLGMARPVVAPAPDNPTVWLLRPNRAASLTTTLRLARVGDGGPWTVTDARASGIVVDTPARLATVTSPTTLRGKASAFEGTVEVQVRQDGMRRDESLGSTFVQGGGGGELGPFEGRVTFRTPETASGAIVFWEASAEDGSAMAATVVRVHFGAASKPQR